MVFHRMAAYTPGQANSNPSKRLASLSNLVKNQRPHVCVLRGEGIGDVIMTTPTLKALSNIFSGNLDLTYATNTRYLEGALVKSLAFNPYITRVIDRDQVNESDYDAVFSLHCPALKHEKPHAIPINRIDLFARSIGITQLADPLPSFFLQEKEIEQAKTFLEEAIPYSEKKQRIIVFNPFSSCIKRSLDSITFFNILKDLVLNHNCYCLIIKNKSDYTSNVNWKDLPKSQIVDSLDVRQIAAVLTQVDLLFCPDSALLHVAGALSIPTVSIFGPTDPRARVNYYPTVLAIWEGKNLHCAPCYYEECKYSLLCMKNTIQSKVIDACLRQFNKFSSTK